MKDASTVTTMSARAIALRGDEIDTDRIIPARFLRSIVFDGLGEHAFEDERFDAQGRPTAHPMNDSRFAGAGIMVVGRNFGCGSSREHAPQALARWGIRALVGVSFADIFAGNCAAIGIPVLTAPAADIERLQAAVEAAPQETMTVDLEAMSLRFGGLTLSLGMTASHRRNFLAGTWDTLAALSANPSEVSAVAARLPYVRGFEA